MDRSGGPVDPNRILSERIRSSFTTNSLSVLSVIQGVALARLASQVGDNHADLSFSQWVMAAVTLLLLVVVWCHLYVNAAAFTWVPTFWDVALPFGIGAMEFLLCYALIAGPRAWLASTVLMGAFAMAELWYTQRRLEQSAEDQELLPIVRERWRMQRSLNLAGLVTFSLLALGSGFDVFLETTWTRQTLTIVAVLLVGGWLVGYALIGKRWLGSMTTPTSSPGPQS